TYTGGTGWIGFLDRAGKRTTLYTGWVRNCGLDWLPDGREVWFAIPDPTGAFRDLLASSRPGATRALMRVPGPVTIQDVSRDGTWALTMDASTPPRLILLPAGVGQPKSLPVTGFETYYFARWLPDGKRIFFNANPPGRAIRCHVLDLAGGSPRAIGPEGASC